MKLLSLARDLQRRKARERETLFVAEGVRTVEELLRSPLAIRGVLLAPQISETPRGALLRASIASRGLETLETTERDFASAAATDSPQGVLAVAEQPSYTLDSLPLVDSFRLLVLDAVQDPGNVGTLLRTAAGLGALATITLPGTADLWNAKVVRGAMGAHFTHPAVHCTWDELASFLEQRRCVLWAADVGGEPIGKRAIPSAIALAVGNEGQGLTPAVRQRATALVSLPLAAGVESLNVAVAAGILLHELRP